MRVPVAFSADCLALHGSGQSRRNPRAVQGCWSAACESLAKLPGAPSAPRTKMRAFLQYSSPDPGEEGVEARGQQEWLFTCST